MLHNGAASGCDSRRFSTSSCLATHFDVTSTGLGSPDITVNAVYDNFGQYNRGGV